MVNMVIIGLKLHMMVLLYISISFIFGLFIGLIYKYMENLNQHEIIRNQVHELECITQELRDAKLQIY